MILFWYESKTNCYEESGGWLSLGENFTDGGNEYVLPMSEEFVDTNVACWSEKETGEKWSKRHRTIEKRELWRKKNFGKKFRIAIDN